MKITRSFFLFIITILLFSQTGSAQNNVYIQILGIAQDGGYPHLGCKKQCCTMAWANDSLKKNVVSFALVDSSVNKWWLFEATPDIKEQLQLFKNSTGGKYNYLPDGILLTHAHIGHYTGLMELGREVMNEKEVPVYVLDHLSHLSPSELTTLMSVINTLVLKKQIQLKLKIIGNQLEIQ